MKRIFLFLGVNLLVMMTLSVITSLFGIRPYLNAYGIDFTQLLLFCLVWGMGGSIISLFLSKHLIKWQLKLRMLSAKGEGADIVQIVYRHARSAGITTMPEVAIYDSAEVNAFATGASKNNSLVAVSSGLVQSMNRAEIDGVIGHEVAHIANGDMVTMALVTGVVNSFVMFLSRALTFVIDNAMRDENGRGGLGFFARFAVTIFLDMVFGLLAMPLIAWFSRYREFRADRGGAKYAGKANMIAALTALQRNTQSLSKETPELNAMKISSRAGFMQLISTHPPLEDRIKALRENI